MPWDLGNVTEGAEYALNEAYKALKDAEQALADVDNETYLDATTGLPKENVLPGEDADNDGVPDNIDNPQVKENLKAAWDNYYTKKNAADELERRLNAAQNGFDKDGDLNVYIYLKNVSLTGDQPGQWQLLPSDLSDLRAPDGKESAEFYYTSILAGGEVSNQLIDYVELNKSANQDMYKYFDFDLNITLDSVQVGFDENGSRNTQPVNEEWQSVRAAIKDPTKEPVSENNETVVTWSQNATAGTDDPTAKKYFVNGDEITVTKFGTPVELFEDTGINRKSFSYSFTSSPYTYYGENEYGTYYKVYDGTQTYDPDVVVTVKPNP